MTLMNLEVREKGITSGRDTFWIEFYNFILKFDILLRYGNNMKLTI